MFIVGKESVDATTLITANKKIEHVNLTTAKKIYTSNLCAIGASTYNVHAHDNLWCCTIMLDSDIV